MLSGYLGVTKVTSVGIAYADADRSLHDFYAFPEPIRAGVRVLLVEDLLESGNRLLAATRRLEGRRAQVVTAALYYQSRSQMIPDVTLGVLDEPVTFPWEVRPIHSRSSGGEVEA
ncbi:hypothetical protein Acsp03_17800 [Actinomadura sp. NBRC 104412]|nr:hypothetical protein Acsp03_17800 [Actinomadura sp. NBRC 104412]